MRRDQTLHEELIPLLVDRLGVKSYLELGIYQNNTLGPVAARCRNLAIHGVDINEPHIRIPGVFYHIMTTSEFISAYASRYAPYDFVFIDADHSAESAMADFSGIIRHVSPEGLVLLHDTNPQTVADTAPGLCGDSWRLNRIFRDLEFECVALPYHPGLTIYRKRERYEPVG